MNQGEVTTVNLQNCGIFIQYTRIMILDLQIAALPGVAWFVSTAAALLLSAWTSRSVWSWYRLRHIPGPALAGVSAFWLIRKSASGKFHDHMRKVSEQYGKNFVPLFLCDV
jgi:hypothetical protein